MKDLHVCWKSYSKSSQKLTKIGKGSGRMLKKFSQVLPKIDQNKPYFDHTLGAQWCPSPQNPGLTATTKLTSDVKHSLSSTRNPSQVWRQKIPSTTKTPQTQYLILAYFYENTAKTILELDVFLRKIAKFGQKWNLTQTLFWKVTPSYSQKWPKWNLIWEIRAARTAQTPKCRLKPQQL